MLIGRRAPLALCLIALAGCRPGREAVAPDLVAGLPVVRTPAVAPREKLSAVLRRFVDAGRSDERLRLLVDLGVQLDIAAVADPLQDGAIPRPLRRDTVVAALRSLAESTQATLRPLLDDLVRRGAMDSGYRGFSVVNRLLVRAAPAAVRALAERDEVARLVEARADPNPALMSAAGALAGGPAGSWAHEAVGVARAWQRGLDGTGVVVGIIDAGASAAHEQLRANYRQGARAWYDPSGKAATPSDGLDGHGTGMVSAAVGANVAGKTVGVAPRARWIACVGIPRGRYDNVALTECADWMLAVGRPDVLINSWSLPSAGCDREFERVVAAWRAAEIVPVFAAGNYGPGPGTDRSPANYRGVLAVGGLASDRRVLARSSRGPNRCDGSVYPALVAPAGDVTVAHPLAPSAYVQSRGTSVAAGLVAGAAALLLQRYPDATVAEIEAALRAGAVDLDPPGPDNAAGYGRLDILGALDSLGALLKRRETRIGARPASHVHAVTRSSR